MTIQIKHAFTSAKGDGGDATLVRPSNWNAAHTTSMATLNLLGRLTAGVGVFEEVPITAFMAALLTSADAAAVIAALGAGVFSTGDVKFSIDSTVPAGWISYQGSFNTSFIGNVASAANVRASADCLPLYTAIYNSIVDIWCPVTGGRTGNPTNDFNAGKKIALPWFTGKTLVAQGNPSFGGFSNTINGQYFGEELHTLTPAEIAIHFHTAATSEPGHTHPQAANTIYAGSGAGVGGGGSFGIAGSASTGTGNASVRLNSANGLDTTNNSGGGGAHENRQPSMPLWLKVKL